MMAHVTTDWRRRARDLGRPALAVGVALAGGTLLAFLLETWLGLADASSVYLLAVAAVAIGWGTLPAIATAAGGFLVYNFLFIDPRLSFIVAGPQELLTLLLLLGLGILIGRLAGLQRDRARQAARREGEARALFAISRLLSSGEPSEAALAAAVQRLATETGMDPVWVGLGTVEGQERIVARTGPVAPLPRPATYALLRRQADEGRAEWVRIHMPAAARLQPSALDLRPALVHRVELAVGGETIGSLWAVRPLDAGEPHLEETRLLAAAADQMGQAIHRERLARQAVELEVARRSDELKTALLVSVSHDLRTPLAAIRAAAGNLADPAIAIDDAERRATAAAIDDEAERLNRLVGNLIDMSRIEGRELAPDLEAIPLGYALESVMERLRPMLGARPVEVEIPPELPPVRADATLLDQILANLLENVARHTPAGTPLRLRATSDQQAGSVLLTVEDAGSGVPDAALPRLFDRFYRSGEAATVGARPGSGLGLAVVRGFVEAMGGHADATRAPLGGLMISLRFDAHARAPSEALS